jgi:hypothetical protein
MNSLGAQQSPPEISHGEPRQIRYRERISYPFPLDKPTPQSSRTDRNSSSLQSTPSYYRWLPIAISFVGFTERTHAGDLV